MIVAQISDLHTRRRGHVMHYMPNTADYLRRTIDRLHAIAKRYDRRAASSAVSHRRAGNGCARVCECRALCRDRSRLGIGVEAAGVLLHEWNFNAEVRTYIARLEASNEQQIA